jgi:hypothetical protein
MAVNSIFTPAQTWAGSFRADMLTLTFGTLAGDEANANITSGMLIQNMQFNFQQSVQLLYELGANGPGNTGGVAAVGSSTNVYYVAGHAQGTANIQRIVGPGKLLVSFFKKYGNVCTPGDCTFGGAQAKCENAPSNTSGSVNYILKNCVLTTIGGSVNSNDVVMSETLGVMFTDLQYDA